MVGSGTPLNGTRSSITTMETGFYKKHKIRWSEFEADLFIPHLFNLGNQSPAFGCGANTLALLTGVAPSYIRNTNRQNRHHWKDSFMIKFLKENGFKVRHITKCDVSNTDPNTGYSSAFVNDRHVLMLSQLMNKNVASWSIAHNQLWYHNFQTCSFSPTSLLNQPTLNSYLIIHPKWRSENWSDKSKTKR